MDKTLDRAAILEMQKAKETSPTEAESAEFKADTLQCVITDANGNEVLSCALESRGFKAKANSKGHVAGGVGWYAGISGDDSGEYQGFPVTAGLRLSLGIGKVEPGTKIDLTTKEDNE